MLCSTQFKALFCKLLQRSGRWIDGPFQMELGSTDTHFILVGTFFSRFPQTFHSWRCAPNRNCCLAK